MPRVEGVKANRTARASRRAPERLGRASREGRRQVAGPCGAAMARRRRGAAERADGLVRRRSTRLTASSALRARAELLLRRGAQERSIDVSIASERRTRSTISALIGLGSAVPGRRRPLREAMAAMSSSWTAAPARRLPSRRAASASASGAEPSAPPRHRSAAWTRREPRLPPRARRRAGQRAALVALVRLGEVARQGRRAGPPASPSASRSVSAGDAGPRRRRASRRRRAGPQTPLGEPRPSEAGTRRTGTDAAAGPTPRGRWSPPMGPGRLVTSTPPSMAARTSR